MSTAVLYARVSSKDQERGACSIPAQQKLLREYALRNGPKIVNEFVDLETAEITGRKQSDAMVEFLVRTSSRKMCSP
jgi:DNA invertase Pin-like site-specific DNA recombinase